MTAATTDSAASPSAAVEAADVEPQPSSPEHNRIGLDYRRPMHRPKVRGIVIDAHVHLHAARHADAWFEAADHYGIDFFITMSPLEEALKLHRRWGHRLHFIAIPQWQESAPHWVDNWLRRIQAFYNIGSRIVKFHCAPGSIAARGWRLDLPAFQPLFDEVVARRMAIMTHVGDPDTWYSGKYSDAAKYGTRDEHFHMWLRVMDRYPHLPWIGAHLGGNPENLPRLQWLLDNYPNLMLDCSATKWLARELSVRRDAAREFFIRNQDRILFGTDQVSNDKRGFDFLASRYWVHRKLWETAYIGPSPIHDPDQPDDRQPELRGLALPDGVLQKLYHDNAARLLNRLNRC
jgi:hypothetical protein